MLAYYQTPVAYNIRSSGSILILQSGLFEEFGGGSVVAAVLGSGHQPQDVEEEVHDVHVQTQSRLGLGASVRVSGCT